MGSEDLRILRQKEEDFINASDRLQTMWIREQKRAERRIGQNELMRLNNAMNDLADSTDTPSVKKVDDGWVQDILCDMTDPLNQKLQEVSPQIAALKAINSSKKSKSSGDPSNFPL